MEVWIIRDGEKVGPMHDFEIRRKIELRELPAGTLAWHEGLLAWKPLGEIDLFAREFEKDPNAKVTGPKFANFPHLPSDAPATQVPPTSLKSHYLRRFWARWFDLYVYSGCWWFGMWAAGQDIEAALFNSWVTFFHFVPWFVLEALLLHYWGTTPGKWLLGLAVTNQDGSRLDLVATIRRSLRVLFTGIGFGWGLLALICQIISLFIARWLGTPPWDHTGGHRVVSKSLNPLKVILLISVFFAALQLQMIVTSPFLVKIMGDALPAVLKAEFEKNPPWHLPDRHRAN
ncbi:MAG: RDD family protein [Akkermansiaceae bacterium]|nr:RDD family protein [Akkermansiaceae bacterium]